MDCLNFYKGENETRRTPFPIAFSTLQNRVYEQRAFIRRTTYFGFYSICPSVLPTSSETAVNDSQSYLC